MEVTTWWLSNHKMTVMIKTNQNRQIIEAAPIVKKFIGQPLSNLAYWMDKIGKLDWKILSKQEIQDE